jgi:hypothetical protein
LKLYAETIITPKELGLCKILNREIVLKKFSSILIKGKIMDLQKKPVQGTVILVKSINYNYKPPKVKDEEYVTTNVDGAYAINVQKDYNIKYKLDIYEPIIKE